MSLPKRKNCSAATLGFVVCLLVTLTGCHPFDNYSKTLNEPLPAQMEPPNEVHMVSLPEYRIQPPDILQLDVVKLVPRPPYRVDIFDVLKIRAAVSVPNYPVDDFYRVDESGFIDLGPKYGKVHALGLLPDEVKVFVSKLVQDALAKEFKIEFLPPAVTVQLARTGGTQQIDGVYLVQPGGIINLNQYGTVHVAGKTLTEARLAVEKHLGHFFDSPQVGVSVTDFNSAKYYIIFEGTIEGETVITLPITGKDTVLDAFSRIGGLQHANGGEMWISRPAPGDFGCEQILPIDFMAISRGGSAATNYQIMPGDRIYVAEDGQIAMNNYIAKVTAPISRLLNISQLGVSTVRTYQTTGRNYNRLRRGF